MVNVQVILEIMNKLSVVKCMRLDGSYLEILK